MRRTNTPQQPLSLRVEPDRADDPQLNEDELIELGLNRDTQHTKIQFDYRCCGLKDICVEEPRCCYCICCLCAGITYHNHLHARKAAVTDTHFIYKQGPSTKEKIGIPLKEKVEIPLNTISASNLSWNKDGLCCCSSYSLWIETSEEYCPFMVTESLCVLFPLLNPKDTAKMILSDKFDDDLYERSENKRIKHDETLCFSTSELIVFLVSLIVCVINIVFVYETFESAIMDRICSCIALINALILFVILLYQICASNQVQISSRSSIAFGLSSKCGQIMAILFEFMIIIYILHRVIFISFAVVNCVDHYVSFIIHWFILLLFLILMFIMRRKTTDGWMLLLIVIADICCWLLGWFVLVFTMILSEGSYCVYTAIIANISLSMLLFSVVIMHSLIFSASGMLLKSSNGIRVLNRKSFHHKLHHVLLSVERHRSLVFIPLIIECIAWSLWYIPWMSVVSLSIVSWSVFLMNEQNKYIHQILCGCCLYKHRQFDNMVHLDHLLNINKDNHDTHDIKHIDNDGYYNGNECKTKTNECKHVQNMLKTMNAYGDIMRKEDKERLVVKLCTQTESLLDDYIHMITEHNEEEIHDLFMNENKENSNECDIMKCSFLSRHYRDRGREEYEVKYDHERDAEFIFYQDLMDQMHCRLYHLYDIGMRIKRDKNVNSQSVNEEECKYEDEDEYDSEFAALFNEIKSKINKLKFKGLHHRLESNKFNINTNDKEEQNKMFMGGFYQRMVKVQGGVSWKHIQNWLNEEQYDSDALQYDVSNKYSNILNKISNVNVRKVAHDFVRDTKLYKETFSIGFRFYYWIYYKNEQQNTENDHEWSCNKNDHNGYKPHQLYIEAKYASIKEEILQNELNDNSTLSVEQYNTSETKAKKYMKTLKVKEMRVQQLYMHQDPLKYDLQTKAPITLHHILSIIFYCDFTSLSTEFSKTFRKTSPYQTIDEIIKNHQNFAHWARLLREIVEYFGCTGYGYHKQVQTNMSFVINNQLKGPFFCGMSFEMVMPEFNIRLSAPTSTSKHIEVATRFAGSKGIIMQLNNNGTEISGDLRGFPCSWISGFANEDEVIFCGGEYRIRIESVRLISTKQNFDTFFECLYFFDCMMNGSMLGAHYVSVMKQEMYHVLDDLIKHNLGRNGFMNAYSEYINNTFASYCIHQMEITLNLPEIHQNIFALSGLILHKLIATKIWNPTKCRGRTVRYHVNDRNTNLFKTDIIFGLFRNLKHLHIYTKQSQFTEYEMDLVQLLSSITAHASSFWSLNDLQISIKAIHPSWIYYQTNRECMCVTKGVLSSIQSEFNEKDLNIEYKTMFDVEQNTIDCLTIYQK